MGETISLDDYTTLPGKSGARRLHYAAGEVRSYTHYFPMHRKLELELELEKRTSWFR